MALRRIYQLLFLLLTLFTTKTACCQSINFSTPESSVLFKGDSVTAYRDPMVFLNEGTFYLYFTLTEIEKNGKIYMYTAFSKSNNLKKWSPVMKLTPRNQALNYSSPGNIIHYKNEWLMCLQTYPRPDYTVAQMPKYGDASCRLFIMRSKDLEQWSKPELLFVKGDKVSEKDMGRMIDPFILKDESEKGKWWIFYKQNGASRSYSYDLKHWIYKGHIPAGENISIIRRNQEYIMFHSPENGIGIKRSKDLVHWTDDAKVLTLGQQDWPWAKGRITAGFVLDMHTSSIKTGYRYLMFFHGSGPKGEKEGDFDKNASIAVVWSNDLVNWNWK
jgi:predicted GH43/DUF377 family glycosyl hydrolase